MRFPLTSTLAPAPIRAKSPTGNFVGIDIDHASKKLDLKAPEAVALPAVTARES